MKRRYIAFAAMLALVLAIRLGMPVWAEPEAPAQDGYTRAFETVPGIEAPVRATLTLAAQAHAAPEAQESEGEGETTKSEKEFSFTSAYAQGQQARAVFTYTADCPVSEEEWTALGDALGGVLRRAMPDQMGADEMAESVLSTVSLLKASAQPDESGAMPIYAREGVTLGKLEISAPYYAALERGSRGEEVLKLQEKLIELGYLEGGADGQYGKITAAAVEEVEKDLRKREQAEIDRWAQEERARAEAEARAQAESQARELAAQASPSPEGELPQPVPEPVIEIPEIEVPAPQTQVDGAADMALLIRLYSEEFPLTEEKLEKNADAAAVTRLQRRLSALDCLAGAADGDYGSDTRRAVLIFQHYNGLDETGVADEATQRAVFSRSAQSPDHPLMVQGASGDEVEALQERLITLGFMSGTADGDYGNGTVTAVRTLQTYMREREIARLRAEALLALPATAPAQPDAEQSGEAVLAASAPEIEVTPTIAVNGVADPMLLDAFYADDFPVVPEAMHNGDNSLDVTRLQKRLQDLEYTFFAPDGAFGNGTEEAVRAFQERNGLAADGVAGEETLSLLFSRGARAALKPYVLKVSTSDQRVYVYGLDDNEQHTVLVKTFKCSTGMNSTPTPKGTFQSSTCPGARWHYFKKFGCWAQYAYYIQGDILFHSVLYGSKGGAVTSSSVYNLGHKASHGCVRLSVKDAQWIWENCPPHTKVVIY